MEFIYFKSLNREELEEYRNKIEEEYSETHDKIKELCDTILELKDEYDNVCNEITKRESFLKNG